MAADPDRLVLCASRHAVRDLCGDGPYTPDPDGSLIRELFAMPHRWAWLRKGPTESSVDWRQVIPVILLKRPDGSVLAARRLDGATEGRLAGKVTLTVGGHCERSVDARPYHNRVAFCLAECLERELSEELNPTLTLSDLDARPLGLIHSSDSEVDRAHLGWLWEGTVPLGVDVRPGPEFSEASWWSPIGLRSAVECGTVDLESWGRIVLGHAVGA